ncbi:hypothetical protein, partial [Achromobacter ruhlandii]|uniref:hypothetical protein n=1 Tax=Achromobacter ruhlandii TaxID=72557 RepID=UPI0021F0FF51
SMDGGGSGVPLAMALRAMASPPNPPLGGFFHSRSLQAVSSKLAGNWHADSLNGRTPAFIE